LQGEADEPGREWPAVPGQVGEGEGDAPDAGQPPSAEPPAPQLALEQLVRARIERREVVEPVGGNVGVADHPSCGGPGPGRKDPGGDDLGGLAGMPTEEVVDVGAGHRQPQVEAVEQRTRQPTLVPGACRLAALAAAGLVGVAARARVHGGDQQHPGRVLDQGLGPADADDPLLERLAERVEHGGRELAELVEEQDTARGEAELAGSHRGAASTDERDHGRRVVRGPERWPGDGPTTGQRDAGRRVHPRRVAGVGAAERRQQAGQPTGQHGLARSGWPEQQQVVAAGRRDLERLPGPTLAADVGQIG
jgi:hypothetical protein